MGGLLSSMSSSSSSSSCCSEADIDMALHKARQFVSSTPVFIFSKTYCGYCKKVKQLLKQLGAAYQVMELDQESDGNAIQSAVAKRTGQTTVPNVFIGGRHLGGYNDVMKTHQQGQLVAMLIEVKAISAKQTAYISFKDLQAF